MYISLWDIDSTHQMCPCISRNSSKMANLTSMIVLWGFVLPLIESKILQRSENFDGDHLRIVPTQLTYLMKTTTNSSGFVIEAQGVIPDMIDWLSRRNNFSYSYVPSTATLLVDDKGRQRGKLSYLRTGEADMVAAAILLTSDRYKQVDFPMPFTSDAPFILVIPYPKISSNVNPGAVLDPWSTNVWIGVLIAVPTVYFSLYGIIYCLKKMDLSYNVRSSSEPERPLNWKHVEYVICTLLSQGGSLSNNRLAVRLVAGFWCLACFILVQSYNCTLTSVFTLPIEKKPLINSVYDIPKVKGLKIVVTHGMGTETAILSSNDGVFKELGNMLRKYPELRCNSTYDCMNRVHQGFYVYIEAVSLVDVALRADFKKTGICRYSIAKERFWSSPYGFALAKNSRYMDGINKGMMELYESGLRKFYIRRHNPEESFCFTNHHTAGDANKFRLSMKNLTSAFIVLIVGCLVSFSVFLCEIIAGRRCKTSRN